jgi:hypothetical protein
MKKSNPITPEKRTELGQEAGQDVKTLMERRLRRAGLPRSYYMKKLKDLCECTKSISCIRGKEADGGTVDFVDVPDNAVQLNAVKEVIALYGDRAAEKKDVNIKQPIIVEVVKFAAD